MIESLWWFDIFAGFAEPAIHGNACEFFPMQWRKSRMHFENTVETKKKLRSFAIVEAHWSKAEFWLASAFALATFLSRWIRP